MPDPSVALVHALELTLEQRLHLLAQWLAWWHDRPFACASEGDGPANIPKALRLFYSVLPHPATLCRQNHLLEPGDLATIDGKLHFATENQGVYFWATALSGDDPPVFGRWDDRDPWQPDVPTLSLFLLQFMLHEAAVCASYGASVAWLDEASFRRVALDLTALPFEPWNWPAHPTTFFVRGSAIAVAAPNEDAWSLWVGAKSPADVAFLSAHVTKDWEYVSLEPTTAV